ncbi:barstar family protein [Bacillus thuringiensis]|uniref:barstar family protein n=1 Tax=Bacillus thuringiensis TaxID=1428 RepID=UPI000BF27F93|nr:barnase inhibitor [Bacillus thuringiensis]
METIQLNGWKFTSKEIMHKILKNKLDLPNYYGENADVLWDCLTVWRTSFKKRWNYRTRQSKSNLSYKIRRYGTY